MAECRSCGEPILWAKTEAGKSIPLDVEPNSAGNVLLNGDRATVLPKSSPYSGEKYISHFVTCPDADKFRRRNG